MRPKNSPQVALSDVGRALGLPVQELNVCGATAVSGVSADNRRIRPGDVFIARRGAKVHAATFAREAIAAGARAVVTDAEGAHIIGDADVPVLVVGDPARSAGVAAAAVYGNPAAQLTAFGVTGTNGKTSTAFMIDHILRKLGRTTGLIGTVAVRIGDLELASTLTTPQPADLQAMLATLVENGGTDLVMEVSSHALAQGRTEPMRFDVAGFTNLTHDHLDYHGTLEEYFAAKATLFDSDHCERAVVLVDDDAGQRLYDTLATERPGAAVSLSVTGLDADWSVTELRAEGAVQRFTLAGPGGSLETCTQLAGMFNVANAALAIIMVCEAGIPLAQIGQALGQEGVSPVIPGRMEVVGDKPYTVVDFAHNTDALDKAMVALHGVRPGKLIVVTGSAGERDREKRPQMAAAVARHADHLIVTDDDPHGEDPAQIRREVITGIPDGFSWEEIPDRAEAIHGAIRQAGDDDVVLIAGRGHETIQDVAGVDVEIDDRVIARDALARRKVDGT
ncbi:UDP-N-acetylmuramoyl-L-alanyl-D-glutamate--2,6-diaminopimelate ligase [Trueperella bialowiezensis]|uniref:UDP-N-acetylmuramoyl-L-alanyl-D-glutamate--2, 6-diaminopimelate ligase n=1 Tax=Trueperella bialowiezensis TaxID=312285 RepID=UPI001F53EC51|nr:UDP-N-acetylmuramoyl-L-alanyl-D-glutamate--2,6-diaminopimelate ligase [Trueperella bialowiezensis]